ncbi:MAG: hypothetical protein BRC29_04275 [Nanohaloarchaea archaeon SW_7_43_1]|nr:MAG: hypothetical protein BRC29_04275 [Nanohaloarchaea archaeon SW_7_43_1]
MPSSKGISPLIAAVMLLAFVMAIGGLFSEWSGELVESSTQDTKDTQSEVLDCSSKSIEVDRMSSSSDYVNVTLRADGGNLGTVQVIVYPSNKGAKIDLPRDGVINRTEIELDSEDGEQERMRAASTECDVSIEKEIEN